MKEGEEKNQKGMKERISENKEKKRRIRRGIMIPGGNDKSQEVN